MPTDPQLFELASRVGQHLLATNRRMVAAESCTGGWVAKAMTDVPDSSRWFECGYVTYANAAKMRDLGVQQKTLDSHGAVSEETVREMALGALRVSGAEVSVAISGIAGPTGGVPGKPVGTVWFAAASQKSAGMQPQTLPHDVVLESRLQHFPGDREAIRRASVQYALELILQMP